MSLISVLPMQVANLIAAGEVVERPSSVVKELLENAIDAGATAISVDYAEGGIALMRVTDNGHGMSAADAQACFGRHATSKIHTADDLLGITTLGFRGEALAAIAAVSRVTLRTRTADRIDGTEVVVEGGELVRAVPCGCAKGTSVTVRDLFFNTPARKKFLKKERTEAQSIGTLLQHIALSCPDIALRCRQNGSEVLLTSGNGSIPDAFYAVYGQQASQNTLPVDHIEGSIRVHGMIGMPEVSRANRMMQSFFVAGRHVRARTLQVALEEGYKGSIPPRRFPLCVLYIELPLSDIDVNVHPQKMEVRFADENGVYDAVYHAVTGALSKREGRPLFGAVRAEVYPDPGIAVSASVDLTQAQEAENKKLGASMALQTSLPSLVVSPREHKHEPITDWQFYSERSTADEAEIIVAPEPTSAQDNMALTGRTEPCGIGELDTVSTQDVQAIDRKGERTLLEGGVAPDLQFPMQSFRILGELFATYLVVEFEQEVWFVDKHAARERILYEELKASDSIQTQQLLSPHLIESGQYLVELAEQHREELLQAGLDAEPFGNRAIILRTLPMGVDAEAGGDLLEELCLLFEGHRKDKRPDAAEEALHRIACSAAVKGGVHEAPEAGEALVAKLLLTPALQTCPHGRPCVKVFTKRFFDREFLRV